MRRLLPWRARPYQAAVVGAVLFLSACGLPVDGEIHTLDTDEYGDVVFGLDTTTTTEPLPDEGTPIRLFFFSEDDLESVIRPFLFEPPVPEILVALQEGPSESELAENPTLRTQLPAGLNPNPQPRAEGEETVIVNVDDEGALQTLINEDPERAEQAITQMVCTLTTLNLVSGVDITGVEFHDSNGRIQILDSDGASIDGPARASDFNDCMTQQEIDEQAEDADQEGGESTTTTTEG